MRMSVLSGVGVDRASNRHACIIVSPLINFICSRIAYNDNMDCLSAPLMVLLSKLMLVNIWSPKT